MALTKFNQQFLSTTDVLSNELDMYSRRTKSFPVLPACVPGTVVDDNGVIVGADSTSANIILEYKNASTTPVSTLVANTNVHIKAFALVCDDVEHAIELLRQDPTVFFSGIDELN